MRTIVVETSKIVDGPTFHATLASAMGFPSFYGCNMDAWIDCMSSLTDGHPLAAVRINEDEQLLLVVPAFESLAKRAPEVARAFLECTAAVNSRYGERGENARVALVLE
ncbi:barstar family protein [Polaromonas sp.]|uniref:barstar family protein n=1 Tax=Polaromonas sp. TaxID=1869339 RepID=UPI002FCC99A2